MKHHIFPLLLFVLVSTASLAQLRAFKTYKDYEAGQPTLTRDGVHMNGAFKGEGELEKFVDEKDKAIGFKPDDYWGFTYDSVLFRCLPDKQMNYAAVMKVADHLYIYSRGASALRLMANSEAYGRRYAQEMDGRNELADLLLEPMLGFSGDLKSSIVLWNEGKKEFQEILGRYYKEEAIDEFKKAFFRADSNKIRYEVIMELLKGAKK